MIKQYKLVACKMIRNLVGLKLDLETIALHLFDCQRLLALSPFSREARILIEITKVVLSYFGDIEPLVCYNHVTLCSLLVTMVMLKNKIFCHHSAACYGFMLLFRVPLYKTAARQHILMPHN